jgi:hypothetical protein
MPFLKLEQRYLNLSHVVSVEEVSYGVEVVTPYEVVRLTGSDAQRVLEAVERLANRAWPQPQRPEPE